MIVEIVFESKKLPDHETLAGAYLAVAEVAGGQPLPGQPTVDRINEDYGFRQEERYTYGSKSLGLHAHAVGLMSGHGRHGSRTSWTGKGLVLKGTSQLNRLGKSFATLDLSGVSPDVQKKAEKAFRMALTAYDARSNPEGEALAAIQTVVGTWQTGTQWNQGPSIEALRAVEAASDPQRPIGVTVRFLLARLLLLNGGVDEAEALLLPLAALGHDMAFCRGIACGLASDGSLWMVYRPSDSPPPRPWMEVMLALGWVAECRGSHDQATARYQAIVDTEASLSGGIRPDTEAQKQLDRLRQNAP